MLAVFDLELSKILKGLTFLFRQKRFITYMQTIKVADKYWYIHTGLKLVYYFSVLVQILVIGIEITARYDTCWGLHFPTFSSALPTLIHSFRTYKYLL